MFKSSMSVSPYSIAQFLNSFLKNKKQKFCPIGICDEEDGLVAVSISLLNTSLNVYNMDLVGKMR